jgi:hypothetical protein
MADDHAVSIKLKETLDMADKCFTAENGEGYSFLREQLEELETLAERDYRDHADYKSIAKKLENGDTLTPDELENLKLFMVGDANYYLKYDDDFDRSKTELKRILDEIRELQPVSLDVDQKMRLGVLCREASAVAKTTAFYFEEKERIRKFEKATRGGIDRETGKVLANILKGV